MSGKTREEKTLSLRWLIVPTVFVLDRLSKIWVLSSLKEGEGFPLVSGMLHVTRVNNTGAAFGLWRGASLFLVGVTALCITAIAVMLVKGNNKETPDLYGWALILGGALGNLYDRLRFGHVIDFIDLRVWPVFNLADACICVGAAIVVWGAFRASRTA